MNGGVPQTQRLLRSRRKRHKRSHRKHRHKQRAGPLHAATYSAYNDNEPVGDPLLTHDSSAALLDEDASSRRQQRMEEGRNRALMNPASDGRRGSYGTSGRRSSS